MNFGDCEIGVSGSVHDFPRYNLFGYLTWTSLLLQCHQYRKWCPSNTRFGVPRNPVGEDPTCYLHPPSPVMGVKWSKDEDGKENTIIREPNENYTPSQRGPGHWGAMLNDTISRLKQNDPKLKIIRLGSKRLGLDGATEVFEALQSNFKVEVLDMSNNAFGKEALLLLSRSMIANVHLHSVDLSHNPIGPDGMHMFVEPLFHNECIERLIVNDVQLGARGGRYISEIIHYNNSITDLDASSNNLGSKGAAEIGSALCNTFSLRRLKMGYNNIGDKGLKQLASGMTRNKSLQILDICNNNIGPPVCSKEACHASQLLTTTLG